MQLLAVTRLKRLHGYGTMGTIRGSNDMIHPSLCTVGEDITTGILLGFFQCVVMENFGGIQAPIDKTPRL